jgi:4'-phosphopantetheinyl transferase
MPLIYKKSIDKDSFFGVWEITENYMDLLSGLSLNNSEFDILNSFKSENRKIQWLSYRVLIKELVNLDVFFEMTYDEHGKPYLLNPNYELSVSHSGNYSAVILSKRFHAGIDIEKIDPKIYSVISKFLNEKEQKNLDSGESALEKIYVYWCAKEALYKLYGKKNVSLKEHIHINSFDYSKEGEVQGEIISESFSLNYRIQYFKLNNYMLCYLLKEK